MSARGRSEIGVRDRSELGVSQRSVGVRGRLCQRSVGVHVVVSEGRRSVCQRRSEIGVSRVCQRRSKVGVRSSKARGRGATGCFARAMARGSEILVGVIV